MNGSLHLSAKAREHVIEIEEERWILLSFRVPASSDSVPGCIPCRVCIQAGDDAIKDTNAVSLRQLQKFRFKVFYGDLHTRLVGRRP